MTNLTTSPTAILNDLLTCGSCGSTMESAEYEGMGRFYRCTRNQGPCTDRPICANRIEHDVLSHAAEAFLDEKGLSRTEQWHLGLRARVMPDIPAAASDPERQHMAMLAIAKRPERCAEADNLRAARELVARTIRQVTFRGNEITVQFPNPALDRSGKLGGYYGPATPTSEMF